MTVATRKPVDMEAFMNWVGSFGRKFEATDIHRQPRLFQAALEYARSYSGDFTYMVDMKANVQTYNQLSVGQAKGVLNCARAEALRRQPRAAAPIAASVPAPKAGITVESHEVHDARFQAMLDRELKSAYTNVEAAQEQEAYYQEMLQEQAAEAAMSAHAMGFRPERLEAPDAPYGAEAYDSQLNTPAGIADIEEGTYTVVFDGDESDRITLRLSVPKWATDVTGKLAVSYLYGPDNTNDYKGIGFFGSGSFSVWRSARPAVSREFEARINEALQIISGSDQGKMRESYALRSGRCARCGRKLTVPASLHAGVGPECRKYYN